MKRLSSKFPENFFAEVFGKTLEGYPKVTLNRKECIASVENILSNFFIEEENDDSDKSLEILKKIYELHYKKNISLEKVAKKLKTDFFIVRIHFAYLLKKCRYPSRCRVLRKFL